MRDSMAGRFGFGTWVLAGLPKAELMRLLPVARVVMGELPLVNTGYR